MLPFYVFYAFTLFLKGIYILQDIIYAYFFGS